MALPPADAMDPRRRGRIHRRCRQHRSCFATTTAPHPDWRVTLNSATIEDIVINAHDQVDEPTATQLFDAFTFYVDNEDFILL
ncbi:hypothetical protein UA19_02849 [Burkholderia multivorans]|nr:hypothetical protein NP80_499 [Burkholderia multivorans ATCC BAA-247]SAK22450.1 hypothetical protein UA19_02849 [Burkholderia multivorans]SAK24412.1 hypothetical protein UA21_03396 [Burkholderia multivorans]SPU97795.1 Uncharacterised protein [Burkholderia multivorans]